VLPPRVASIVCLTVALPLQLLSARAEVVGVRAHGFEPGLELGDVVGQVGASVSSRQS
jgi:hypothetical protein